MASAVALGQVLIWPPARSGSHGWSSSAHRSAVSPRKLAGGKLLLDHPADALARLTIANPEKRNALDHEVLDALAEALPRLDKGIKIRCVLITGQGRAFSAGYDIGDFEGRPYFVMPLLPGKTLGERRGAAAASRRIRGPPRRRRGRPVPPPESRAPRSRSACRSFRG